MNHVISALKEKRFFKLVCGASLTDTKMVENLSLIFTLAGAHVIDLAPIADVILAARKGIEKAQHFFSSAHWLTGSQVQPLLMASIQLDKDPHFRKVEVDYNLCDLCGACVTACPTEAFVINQKFIYSIERCFGCGVCPDTCHVNALTMIDSKPTPKETLKEMLLLGVEAVEFHFGKNYKKITEIWNEIKEEVKRFSLVSFSIGSDVGSTDEIKNAANVCYRLAGKDIILQCDGIPMSGAFKNGNNKDMDNPYIKVAGAIQKENLPVYLQISGGTNENSYTEAINAGINLNGVAIGSYARKLLMSYLNSDTGNLKEAVKIASMLVNSCSKTELSKI